MKKYRILLAIIIMLLLSTFSLSTGAVTLTVNQIPKEIVAYEIKGNNYFKLRDMAQLLSGTSAQFDVLWDEAAQSINLVSGAPYSGTEAMNLVAIPNAVAASNSVRILKDGKEVIMCAYMIADSNYFKLRDLAAVMDFAVTYDGATGLIGMDTAKPYEFPSVPQGLAINFELFSYIGQTKEQLDARLGAPTSTEFNPVNNPLKITYDTYSNGCVVQSSIPWGGEIRTISSVKMPLGMFFYNCPETLTVDQIKPFFVDYDYSGWWGSELDVHYFNAFIKFKLTDGLLYSTDMVELYASSNHGGVTEIIHIGNEAFNTISVPEDKLYSRFVEREHNGGMFSGDISPEYILADIDGDGVTDLLAADTRDKHYSVVFTLRNKAVVPLYFLAENECFATYSVMSAEDDSAFIYAIMERIDEKTAQFYSLNPDGSKVLLETIRVEYDMENGQTYVYSNGKLLPNDEYGSMGDEAYLAFRQFSYGSLYEFGWGQTELHWTEV